MDLLVPLRRPLLLVLLAVGAATLAPDDAAAQVRPGQVPGPMTTRGLEREGQRLRLSAAQVEAVEDQHETYRAEYDALRPTVFDPYRDTHLSTLAVRTMEEADERRRAIERVLRELDAVEKAFFDRVAAVLSEEQAARLPSIRARRERQRIREVWPQPFRRVRSAAFDLGVVVDELDLPAGSREAAWPLVASYEQRLTEALRHLHRTALDIPRRAAAMRLELQERQRQSLERLREAYDAPPALPDEERRRWVQERSQEIIEEHRALNNEQMEIQRHVQDALVEEALALGRLDRALLHELADVLPEEAMEAVRERYLYRAYPDLPRDRGPAARLFDKALAIEDLTDEQRALLLERRAAFRIEIDAVTERMLDTIDEFHGVNDPFLRPDPDDPQRRTYDAKREQLENARRTINEATAEAIAAALGAAHAPVIAEWTTRYAEYPATMTSITIMFPPGGGPGGRAERATVQTHQMPVRTGATKLVSGREHLPDPISTRDVERWVALLGLDETQAVLVDVLHDDYLVRIDETVDPDLRALAETVPPMWAAEAGSDEPRIPDAALIERVSRVRRRAMEAIIAADMRFFDDVAVAVYDDRPPPQLDHLRARRMRAAYRRPGADNEAMVHTIINGTMHSLDNRGLRTSAGGIDLADLVDGLELDAATRAAVDPRLIEYSERALTHALRRYEASMRFQAALEKLVARRLRDEPAGGSGPLDPDDAYVSVRDVDGRAARDARQALTALNTETLAALRAELPPDAGERLRRAWNRARFPNVFDDHHSAMPMLTRALELPDLSEEQRERATELAAEFRLGFNELCEQLVAIREHEPARVDIRASRDDRQERMRAQREHTDRLRALLLERSELRDKTIARLRRLLDETQNETLEQRTQAAQP